MQPPGTSDDAEWTENSKNARGYFNSNSKVLTTRIFFIGMLVGL